jgi:hypothetical protein
MSDQAHTTPIQGSPTPPAQGSRTPPLCINCKHFVRSPNDSQALFGKCGRTALFNPVDGSPSFQFAEMERLSGRPCGAWGEKFEPAT